MCRRRFNLITGQTEKGPHIPMIQFPNHVILNDLQILLKSHDAGTERQLGRSVSNQAKICDLLGISSNQLKERPARQRRDMACQGMDHERDAGRKLLP
ncbi:MAG: hypothetical protein ACYSR5_08665, partial [Planctomycetota bacterium]